MKTYLKRLSGAILAIIMFVSMVPNVVFKATATSAVAQSTYVTGDLYTIGSYPQTKVTDSALISTLNLQALQADSTVTYNGSKYLKQSDWFKFEPLQWRVLSNTNEELFVMADKILDTKPYNQDDAEVTWETCTMRTWLNNNFYNTAFNPAERAKIKTSTVVNADNPWYGTEGGNDTSDKLFLLSFSEVTEMTYGFSSDDTRIAQGTDYAKSCSLYAIRENSYWWLRSPGKYPVIAGIVYYSGSVYNYGFFANEPSRGIRPAFKINLKSDIFTSLASSGCVVDYEKMTICGLNVGTTSLDGYVNVASGYELTCIPTQSGFGTGTVANVTKDGEIVQSYKIVIFGDVNGDGNIDSMDAGTMVDIENDAITWNPTTDSALYKAGDLNGDGNIDSIDAGLAVDYENGMVTINQSTGIAT